MAIDSSKFFDSIRIKPNKLSAKAQARAKEEAMMCEWAGCQNKGPHRAPKGRTNSREYWHFCLDHVREYNQSYNFFQGMNPEDVARYQKDALTGHRGCHVGGAIVGVVVDQQDWRVAVGQRRLHRSGNCGLSVAGGNQDRQRRRHHIA